MGKSYKDAFGDAVKNFERELKKNNGPKEVPMELLSIPEQIKRATEMQFQEDQRILKERMAKREWEEEIRYPMIIDQALWQKNREIIKQKENGTYVKPGREPKPVAPAKVVEILSVMYGIQEIAIIDITGKVKVGEKVTNEVAGSDPCPKKKKNVIVRAKVDGVEVERTFVEGKKIIF